MSEFNNNQAHMTQVRMYVSESVDHERWDEQAKAFGAPVFHSSSWADYRTCRKGSRPLFLRWISADDGKPVGLAVGVLSPVGPGLRRIAMRLELDSPPVNQIIGADLLSPLIAWARSQWSIVELRLGSFEQRGTWCEGPLPESEHRFEFLLDPAPRDKLVRGMRRLARRSIRKAEDFGLVVKLGGAADVAAFGELYEATLARLHRTKGVPQGSIDVNAVINFINAGAARLYVTHEAGEMHVGWLFGVFGESAYSLLSGSDDRALETGAVPFTLAHALGDLSDLRIKRLNLGGVSASARHPSSPDHGLYAFKVGLGGQPVGCTSVRIAVRPIRGRAVAVARRVARTARRLI